MHTWTKIRHKLENEYLAESLRGHIRYFCTSYTYCPDHEGRAAILLDKQEIISGGYYNQWVKAHLLPHDEKLEMRLKNEMPFMDDTAVKLGMFDQRCFYEAFNEFDNQSIDKSLASENILVRIFAVLDRRVGKRTLKKIGRNIENEPKTFRVFYDIRMNAENNQRGSKRMKTYVDCISVENMRESDRLTIERYVSGRTLMYRAALGVYRAVRWNGDIAIAVGGGNNGGDGYALACILANDNIPCRIVNLSEKLTEDSAFFADKAETLGVPKEPYTAGAFKNADIIVDCLLGTGFQGSLREPWLGAVREINACGAYVVSVDINSGMNGDTGEAETAVISDITVTIGYVKRGLVAKNAASHIKKLVVTDIGIVLAKHEYKICPESVYREGNNDMIIPAPSYLQPEGIDVSGEELVFN